MPTNSRRRIMSHQASFLSPVMLILLVFSCFPNLTTSFNLSSFESALLQSRLDGIAESIKTEFGSTVDDNQKDDITAYDTFIFPGAGGVDELVVELNKKIVGSKIIDWKEHRGSVITAAYDGEAVGVAIADLLAGKKNEKVHFIGISVGAFCANAAAATAFLNHIPNKPANVRLT